MKTNNLTKQKLISLISEVILTEGNGNKKKPIPKIEKVPIQKVVPPINDPPPPQEKEEYGEPDDSDKEPQPTASTAKDKFTKKLSNALLSKKSELKQYPAAENVNTLTQFVYRKDGNPHDYSEQRLAVGDERVINAIVNIYEKFVKGEIKHKSGGAGGTVTGVIFLRSLRDNPKVKKFKKEYGSNKKAFNRFYLDLKAKDLEGLLGRRGRDYQFGPFHLAAYSALLKAKGKKDKDAETKKGAETKKSAETKKGKKGAETKKDPETKKGEKGKRDKSPKKYQKLGVGRETRKFKSRSKDITLREPSYLPYTLSRKDYKFMIDLIKEDPFIQINQIRRKLRAAKKPDHTNESVVKVKLRKFMNIYQTMAVRQQDEEFEQ